jgi:glyoxylase-like metal-dependent hydrolase (beta-lactamase superfamily II)
MQELAENIYLEDGYAGVALGAINLPHGLIQIDAPPAPEDGRAWRAALLNLGGGVERVLVNLDSHPDRTLGARAMDCTVIAHETTAQVFRSRPNTFKAQGDETGADWERIPGIGSIRWAMPEITFTKQMVIHWNNVPVVLEHHAGPSAGAIWVVLPEQRIVFIGDLALKGQPPFFANANLPAWIESLETLLKAPYRGSVIVSSRGGIVSETVIRNQLELIKKANADLDKLANRQASPAATEKMINPMLASIRAPASRQKQFAQRLRYGLKRYYVRHYRLASSPEGDEE